MTRKVRRLLADSFAIMFMFFESIGRIVKRIDPRRPASAVLAIAFICFGFACKLDVALWIVARGAALFLAVVLFDFALGGRPK